jgi:autotransporter passenger strand-loop-strand repeat protein
VQYVSSGGSAGYTTVSSGGFEFVSAGGSSISTTLGAGGIEVVLSGGVADPTTVSTGGLLVLLSGGSATTPDFAGGSSISGNAVVLVSSGSPSGLGSSANAESVESANSLYVFSGGTADATVVNEGGVAFVFGGTASGTVVDSGGVEIVSGGLDFSATVSGEQGVYGGTTSGTTVDSAVAAIAISGVASGMLVTDSGASFVYSGGRTFGAMLVSGGTERISAGGTASGTVVGSDGSAIVSGGTASDTTIAGGLMLVSSGGSAAGFVDFTTGGKLVLDGTKPTSATISGFAAGDKIDLDSFALTSTGPVPYNSDTGQLTVTEGGSGYTLQFDKTQNFTGDVFSAGNDGNGTTEITLITCFCAGTRIATPDGAVAVETLRAGDLVRLADGRALPVRWLGRQTVSRRFADPLRVLPVRIRAGALGERLPCRDLLVSPGHGLLIEGLLVHASALVDGAMIAREHAMPEVFSYYHVELDEHALLLAEGVAAESFLAGVEDLAFDNAGERVVRLAPELPYPRAKAYRQVPRKIKARIAAAARVAMLAQPAA